MQLEAGVKKVLLKSVKSAFTWHLPDILLTPQITSIPFY